MPRYDKSLESFYQKKKTVESVVPAGLEPATKRL